ncbi:MAG: hypothetical protein P1P88_15730 [Bacteroidales bacterium]|nr:hypothetical protein [Bacteroidales bacterium]
MNRTSLYPIILIICAMAFEVMMSVQISDIKKKAEENKAKKEEQKKEASNKPGEQVQTVPIQTIQVTPAADNFNFLPIPHNDVVRETDNEEYGTIELGCLIPACFSDKDNPNIDFLHNIDSRLLSFEFRSFLDAGYHPSPYWHFMYIDLLPGIRANIEYLIIDFRFNILTEYTNDYPDSFKSWELLIGYNLVALKNFKLYAGTGIHYEDFTASKFNQLCLGSKINLANRKDYITGEIRTSIDYKTKVFPFFEAGFNFNKRVFIQRKIIAHISLGPVYQNYYQSHDIWSFRGRVIVNIR